MDRRIGVIGSLNMDLVVNVAQFPQPGETLTGQSYFLCTGGKGANQAVAAARLGAEVRMIGKVGDDQYGRDYLQILKNNGVKAENIGIEQNCPTGMAFIEVADNGANRIVVIPGANNEVDSRYIESQLDYLKPCQVILLQLEIPVETVIYAVKAMKYFEKVVILDPAPVKELPDSLYQMIDYITPNETELATLTGQIINDESDLQQAMALLLKKGVANVIVKAGSRGVYLMNNRTFLHIEGLPVTPVDSTAAGDAFNAAFAFTLSTKRVSVQEALRFANLVAALSTTTSGTQQALPTLAQVTEFIKEQAKLAK